MKGKTSIFLSTGTEGSMNMRSAFSLFIRLVSVRLFWPFHNHKNADFWSKQLQGELYSFAIIVFNGNPLLPKIKGISPYIPCRCGPQGNELRGGMVLCTLRGAPREKK